MTLSQNASQYSTAAVDQQPFVNILHSCFSCLHLKTVKENMKE